MWQHLWSRAGRGRRLVALIAVGVLLTGTAVGQEGQTPQEPSTGPATSENPGSGGPGFGGQDSGGIGARGINVGAGASGVGGGASGGGGLGLGLIPRGEEKVRSRALFVADRAHVGSPTVVAVVLEIGAGLHINPDAARSGPAWFPGQWPTRLTPQALPDGVRVGAVQFPEPQPYEPRYAPQALQVYQGQAVLYVPVLLAADLEPGELTLKFELNYQACDDRVCYLPETRQLEATVKVVPAGTAIEAGDDPVRDALFAGFDPAGWGAVAAADGPGDAETGSAAAGEAGGGAGKTLAILATALLAGLVLNFTPCVLPMLPLKVMSLAQHGSNAGGRRRTVLLAWVMAAGVVGFWLAIAAAIVGIKQFETVSHLFKYPAFNFAVGGVIAVLGVSMMGLFTINLPRAVYQVNPTGDTVAGSLGFGVMTAVLATPCAGPFMGGAVAWATQQSAGMVLGVFAAIGSGMALPYLALTLMPSLVEKLPRAGAGSELLKQTMGILMLAAAAFFVGTGAVALTSDGTSANSSAYWWAVGGLVAAAGLWVLVRGLGGVSRTTQGRAAVGLCGVVLLAAGGWVGVELGGGGGSDGTDGGGEIAWVYYTPERLAQAQAAGQAVLLDFTADWCLNCKTLEKAVLEHPRVASRLGAGSGATPAENGLALTANSPGKNGAGEVVPKAASGGGISGGGGVVAMKVDITSTRNVAGNNLLLEMGRVTIPLLVVLGPDGQEVFKADFYTVDQVVDALDRATRSSTPESAPEVAPETVSKNAAPAVSPSDTAEVSRGIQASAAGG